MPQGEEQGSPPSLVVGFKVPRQARLGMTRARASLSESGLSKALLISQSHAHLTCCKTEEEDQEWSDSEDEDDKNVRGTLAIPEPRDQAHYKAMVYARAIINAKIWQSQA